MPAFFLACTPHPPSPLCVRRSIPSHPTPVPAKPASNRPNRAPCCLTSASLCCYLPTNPGRFFVFFLLKPRKKKTAALELIVSVLQTYGGARFRALPAAAILVRGELCAALLHHCTSNVTGLVSLSLRVFVALVKGFKVREQKEYSFFVGRWGGVGGLGGLVFCGSTSAGVCGRRRVQRAYGWVGW